jgi:hypothetical protein
MTEERARYYAKVLARSIGVTFYAARSRQGRFLAVQVPSDDCQIVAELMAPRSVCDARQTRGKQTRRAA